jgi:hypothetical protein
MAKKLTDTATVILTSAAARDDRRVLPLPKLKAPPVAVQKILTSLLTDGLIEEIAATRDDEVWEQSEDNGRTTIVTTADGLAAVGVAEEAGAQATSASRSKPTRAHGGSLKSAKARVGGKKAGKGAKGTRSTVRARTGDGGAKKESKQAAVIAMLRRANGASIDEMMAATDWQAHSVRGFMSGALKRRLGLEVVSEKDKKTGERRYHIAAVRR